MQDHALTFLALLQDAVSLQPEHPLSPPHLDTPHCSSHMALSRFHRTLAEKVSPNDDKWSYNVSDLPAEDTCNAAGYMKSCILISNASGQHLDLKLVRFSENRAMTGYSLDRFIHFTCSDFRLQFTDGEPATFKESSAYITRLLTAGITINNTQYHFFGHSNSQLKSKSCFLMAGTRDEVCRIVDGLGDFSRITSVAKKAKRIGLLFSTAHGALDVDPGRCEDIADIEKDGYVLTDGCGLISPNLVQILCRKHPITFRNQRFRPSVFQIRYRGYKGVVTVEPAMKAPTWLQLRKSMRKFSGVRDMSFAVVEYSKPYTYGYLNDEIVLLLSALGISHDTFVRKQQQHLDILVQARSDARTAVRLLSSLANHELAEKCVLEGHEAVQAAVAKVIAQEYGKMLNKRDEQKCRILIPQSRLLFGVCDPRSCLEEGECFVSPTHDENGIAKAISGYVLVSRNPCLHPGDLQKLQAVPKQELAHLVDCIVFAVKGRRPAADMMSGGDLDGDTFFVTWDKDLIPATVAEPAEYPGAKESLSFKPITHEDRIEYFAGYSNMQLGRIKNLYLRWARVKGPLSSECQELNRLFSQCVDAYKVKVPERLVTLPTQNKPTEPFVLDVLHEASQSHIKASKTKVAIESLPSIEVLEGLLEQPSLLSQFELARLTLHWCQLHGSRFEEFIDFFDPTCMSSEERAWVLSNLPPRKAFPSILTNDLLHSDILQPRELAKFDLQNPRIRWRCVFNSQQDRLASLMDVADRTFPRFARKLLVIQVSDRLSVAVYIPQRLDRMDESAVKSSARLFAFPHLQLAENVPRHSVPSKYNSTLYYDHNTFQLFEGKRASTFIFITRAPNDDSMYRAIKGSGSRARAREQSVQSGINREWVVSIALNKFSDRLARYFGRLNREGISNAEMYVISDSDTRSLRHLDLWLERVDTEKMHHNFEHETADDSDDDQTSKIDWRTEPQLIVDVARDMKFDSLSHLTDASQVSPLLEFLWQESSDELARQLFVHHLQKLGSMPYSPLGLQILTCMIEFLDFMPSLVVHFVKWCPWSELANPYQELMVQSVPTFLKALILCVRKVDTLVISYWIQVLKEMTDLSIESLRSLIELLALTVPSAPVALTMLVDGLEPHAGGITHLSLLESRYLLKMLSAIVIDHIEEAADTAEQSRQPTYDWRFDKPVKEQDGHLLLECSVRIDAPRAIYLSMGDHVVFTSITESPGIDVSSPAVFEAVVQSAQVGEARFHCLRRPPPFFQKHTWRLQHCGSFVTSRTMMDTVVTLMQEKDGCCGVFRSLFPGRSVPAIVPDRPEISYEAHERLNPSQNAAVEASLHGPMTCIWGPPGTGKTHAIVSLIQELVARSSDERLLVTAPTHNAVDNVMRQYIKRLPSARAGAQVPALRVSTEVRKVSADLVQHTCDAMLGKDINQFPAARRKAEKRIRNSGLVFSTCVGSGLGLLRGEKFDTVIVDEASQQTEPASLIPLIKGATRVILVGDHVQLRATVRPHSQVLDFDVSLFERLWMWRQDEDGAASVVRKVMLDTQYRMHPTICAFSSTEFYDGRLKTAAPCAAIPVPSSAFPWPLPSRKVLVQVSAPEDRGHASKSNAGQADVAQQVVRLLRRAPPVTENSRPSTEASPTTQPSLAILTPYVRQAEHLRRLCPSETVASIDGFQGQEADIIVFVTVRCNPHSSIGFLRDMRRLNVALTRARAGLVVVGDQATLAGEHAESTLQSKRSDSSGGDDEAFAVWKRLLSGLAVLDGAGLMGRLHKD